MPAQIKIHELKKGDLFYNWEGIILRFVDCEYDENIPDKIKFRVTRYKAKGVQLPETYQMSGPDVANRPFYRFRRRDESSFNAGFRTAMKFLLPHMGIFDKENSGMDNPVEQHFTMMKQYKKWKENSEELW